MTGLTQIGGVNVSGAFASCCRPIVTGNAGIRRGAVIEGWHQPTINHVTGITGRRRGYVSRPHTGRRRTIMTTHAGAKDLGVIHRGGRQPTYR